ncbi:MAG: hypothetical protein COA78_20040 [Blastopirellula sp.]|nr:MAG: hypothetical protein COA78_20040 [Blastopirellula sp.]
MLKLRFLMSLFLVLHCSVFALAEEEEFSAAQIKFFEKEIQPILVKRCIECHGEEKQENDLRLDSRAAILNGSVSGDVVDPDDVDGSLLIRAIRFQDEDYEMPPEGQMPDKEIAAIAKWIEMGLPWTKSEEPEEVPLTFDQLVEKHQAEHWAYQPVSNPAAPHVKQQKKAANPIDHFTLNRLEEKQLTLSEPADRRTLIRRATYDLHGVPPTFAETEAFINDKDPQAYDKLIDRLLASHRYGQQWGRHWLDIARYADTVGYLTGGRDTRFPYSYTYRDYVIKALNDDLPYTEFVKEQLAADYFVKEDDPKLAALGFLTVGRKFLKPDETIDDRIDVVMRGFQAMTIGCARCHNHKYDAISQADYYSLYGVFTSIEQHTPLIGNPEETPGYDEYKKQLDKFEAEVVAYDQKIYDAVIVENRTYFTDYLMRAVSKKTDVELAELEFAEMKALNIRRRVVQLWRAYLVRHAKPDNLVFSPWKLAIAIPENEFAEKYPPLLELLKIKQDEPGFIPLNPLVRQRMLEMNPKSYPEFAHVFGSLFKEITAKWVEHGANDAAKEKLTEPEQQIMTMLLLPDSPLMVKFDQIASLSRRDERNNRQPAQNKVTKHKASSPGAPAHAMAVKDLARPREPVIFLRGNAARRGDKVPRQFLQVVSTVEAPKPFQNGSGRLELAEHIISDDNPLTARVLVNRAWMHHFDNPLVLTPSDFGVRSDPPTHPELLDHLATYVRENNWSQKKLHKYIMLSNTYQQSSVDRPDARAVDPENRLIWKMNRRRLSFEEMRDSVLAANGALDDALGGVAVKILEKPYPTRRTVYGFIDRQDLPNLYRVFDFPNPDATSPQRSKTTVPQQALYMLNNEFVIEQAKALATRILEQGGKRPEMIREFYQTILQRNPTATELKLAMTFIQTAVEQREPETKIGAVHQLAHALMQSNEFMFVD